MDTRGQHVARLIERTEKAIAAGAVTRQAELEDTAARVNGGFSEWVADTRSRLRYLAEALASGRAELFTSHLDWLRQAYEARGVSLEPLRANLRCLRDELRQDLPSPLGDEIDPIVERALARLDAPTSELALGIDDDSPHAGVARAFLFALLEGRRDDAVQIALGALDEGLDPSTVELEVVAAAQHAIGAMWQRGEVHVAEEHLGSRIVEEVLTLLRHRARRADAVGHRVLVAAVRGNLHAIGSRIVADHFELAGWSVVHLGADVPIDDLVQSIRDHQPDLLALSASLALHVRATAETIERVRAELGEGCPHVLVGGPPFRAVSDLWEVVGADADAGDPREAVAVGARLVGGRAEPA